MKKEPYLRNENPDENKRGQGQKIWARDRSEAPDESGREIEKGFRLGLGSDESHQEGDCEHALQGDREKFSVKIDGGPIESGEEAGEGAESESSDLDPQPTDEIRCEAPK